MHRGYSATRKDYSEEDTAQGTLGCSDCRPFRQTAGFTPNSVQYVIVTFSSQRSVLYM